MNLVDINLCFKEIINAVGVLNKIMFLLLFNGFELTIYSVKSNKISL